MRSLAVFAAALSLCAPPARADVVHERRTPYNTIVIREDKPGVRSLTFEHGGDLQSVVRLGDPLHLELGYTRAAMVALAFVPSPKRVLVVGLGGGSMPMFLRAVFPELAIDAVDIDPGVIEVAKSHLGFREDDKLKAHAADARAFIAKAGPAYDVIFLDAYGKDGVPLHLATAEFLREVKARLAPGGVVAANVWTSDNELYPRMLATFQAEFPELHAVNVVGRANQLLFGLAARRNLHKAALQTAARKVNQARPKIPFDLAQLIKRGHAVLPPRKAEILRD